MRGGVCREAEKAQPRGQRKTEGPCGRQGEGAATCAQRHQQAGDRPHVTAGLLGVFSRPCSQKSPWRPARPLAWSSGPGLAHTVARHVSSAVLDFTEL